MRQTSRVEPSIRDVANEKFVVGDRFIEEKSKCRSCLISLGEVVARSGSPGVELGALAHCARRACGILRARAWSCSAMAGKHIVVLYPPCDVTP